MADIPPISLAVPVACVVIGAIVGWLLRGSRVKREKEAIHAGWKEQIAAQREEHDRLVEQNKALMEQVSQFRTSRRDADGRTRELSDSLRETLQAQETLQAEMRTLKSNLDVAVRQRDRLKQDIHRMEADQSDQDALRDKDRKIFKLSRELESWQNRLPPLLDKFRQRSLEAEQLEIELDKANARIAALEERSDGDGTRVEPVDDSALAARLDASNEQYSDDDGSTDPLAAPDSGQAAGNDATDTRSVTAVNGSPQDDLKRIKGVGPAIEKTLHDLGIHSFEQIAEMREVDIDRLARELPGFRSRIYREDWMGQAKLLQQGGTSPTH